MVKLAQGGKHTTQQVTYNAASASQTQQTKKSASIKTQPVFMHHTPQQTKNLFESQRPFSGTANFNQNMSVIASNSTIA